MEFATVPYTCHRVAILAIPVFCALCEINNLRVFRIG